MKLEIFNYDAVTSTMDVACETLTNHKATMPFAICAKSQIQGRGRRGRSWISEPGNLYVTFALSQEMLAAPNLVSLVAGLALYEALSSFKAVKEMGLTLKWPNDVLLARKKIAGLLVEKLSEDYLIGVGANLQSAPEGTRYGAISLVEACQLQVLPQELIIAFWSAFEVLSQKSADYIRTAWMRVRDPRHDHLLIELEKDKEKQEGALEGIDLDGAALIRLKPTDSLKQNADLKRFYAGDVTFSLESEKQD